MALTNCVKNAKGTGGSPKNVTFDLPTLGPGSVQPERDKMLRRLSLDSASTRLQYGPSYSSILNVRRRPSRVRNCRVMKTVIEEIEGKIDAGSTTGNKNETFVKRQEIVKNRNSTSKVKRIIRKYRPKSDSDLEVYSHRIREKPKGSGHELPNDSDNDVFGPSSIRPKRVKGTSAYVYHIIELNGFF